MKNTIIYQIWLIVGGILLQQTYYHKYWIMLLIILTILSIELINENYENKESD